MVTLSTIMVQNGILNMAMYSIYKIMQFFFNNSCMDEKIMKLQL